MFGKSKETLKVYSAAKAIIMEKGMDREEVWNYFSKAFMKTDNGYLNFTYNGYPLELVKGEKDSVQAGNVYKYYGNMGSENYFEITDWNEFDYFAYNEKYAPTSAKAISQNKPGGNRVEFFFKDHFEGVVVEIHRRQKGMVTKRVEKDLVGGANQILGSMLQRYFEKLNREPHSIYVEQDDTLKLDSGMPE